MLALPYIYVRVRLLAAIRTGAAISAARAMQTRTGLYFAAPWGTG